MYIAVSAFMTIWTVILIFIGIPELCIMLGGSTGIFLLLPITVFSWLKFRSYNKLFWSVVTNLICLITINYLYSYFLYNHKEFRSLTRLYIISVPVWGMLPAYIYAVSSFLPVFDKKTSDRKDDKEILDCFRGFLAAVFTLPLFYLIPLLAHFRGYKNINSIGYQIALGTLIAGCLILLSESVKISSETISYFSKSVRRTNYDIKKFRKRTLIAALLFWVTSSYWEIFYRGQWIMWIETSLALAVLGLILYKFGRIIFIPEEPETVRPADIYLPSVKSKTNILLGLVFAVIFFTTIITGALRKPF